VTQEFYISVTPIGDDEYLVRTEWGAQGVLPAQEQVIWSVDQWLAQARQLMKDPLIGLLRGESLPTPSGSLGHAIGGILPSTGQPSANLVAFGQQLYNALFQDSIRDSWMTAQGIAKHRHEMLRLRLGLKDSRLLRLPWEVLHNGDRPLTTGTDVVFSRYHSSFAVPIVPSQEQQFPFWKPDQPLKILMVLAAPTDQEVLSLKQEALHLQEELQQIGQNGLSGHRVSEIQLTILDQPGREQLTQALEHNHYDVFHYAGHSDLGAAGGQLYLVSNKTGLTEALSGDDLAGLLVNNGTRMVVFNSCRGTHAATTDPFDTSNEGSLAEALVKRGILAVLAMAERIPDEVALNLSRLFYRNLKQAYPIDLSLNRARQGLISSYGSHQLYWALPILYLHPEFDGYLQPATLEDGDRNSDSRPDESELPTSDVLVSDHPWDEDLPHEDDLEFDDLEQDADMETVARIVHELSQNGFSDQADHPPLLASSTENLLPDAEQTLKPDDYLILPPHPRYNQFSSRTNPNAEPVTSAGTPSSVAAPNATNAQTYSDLQQMLADTGKLTEAIANCNQAIQINPNHAEAYDNLGLALHQQGYLSEAMTAYQQALRINPRLATVHNHLGWALYQQGHLPEAIQAYERAIQLDPGLSLAQQNLAMALQRQGAMIATTDRSSPSEQGREPVCDRDSSDNPGLTKPNQPQRKPSILRSLAKTPLRWMAAAAIGGTTVLLSIWILATQFNWASWSVPGIDQPVQPPSNPNDLKQVSTAVVAALATEQLHQGHISGAQNALEALLDRGALLQASAVLTPIMSKYPENPTLNFLMGRLAWQFIRTGNKDFTIDDVRRYWERAAKKEATPQHQNALGVAYYREGNLNGARQAWFQSVRLAEKQRMGKPGEPQVRQSPGSPDQSPDLLMAYAGLALVSMKLADHQPPSNRAMILTEAIALRQKILTTDPVNFQADALAKNWMWSEQAIADWNALLKLQ